MNAENRSRKKSFLPPPGRIEEIKKEASKYADDRMAACEISIFTLIALFLENTLSHEHKTEKKYTDGLSKYTEHAPK